MANPTTNFGWVLPASTDLVTDLPADFDTALQGVDTSLVDLKGGTTGQILSKATNTDMDFTWITNDVGDITGVTAGAGLTGGGTSGAVSLALDSAAVIAPTLLTTTGDIIYASAANTPARLAAGASGYYLKANGAGVAPSWATAGGGLTLITRQSFSGVADTGTTFDGVFTSTYRNYIVKIEDIWAATSTDDLHLQLRYAGPTTQAAAYYGASSKWTPAAAGAITGSNNVAAMILASDTGVTGARGSGEINFAQVGNSSQCSKFWGQFVDKDGNYQTFGGSQDGANTYTGFLLKSASSTITGTVSVYGMAAA